ncbi:MAG: DUF484 family protein [Pseudomonadales bacterium]|jgi:uncharacterized protein YigA (DUF484 family)|nr:DUF484 family protein [Pseudomonadales bacterium]
MSEKPAADLARAPAPALSADEVADFLRNHPDFFLGREALLADLALPHGGAGAVSLVERQVALLRERNIEMRRRLNEILRNARTNHGIFERTLAISTSLMDATDVATLLHRLEEGLAEGFELEAVRLRGVHRAQLPSAVSACVDSVDEATAEAVVGQLLRPGRVVCGPLREAELAFLFQDAATTVASAAVMPVAAPGGTLIVALGSGDPAHFSPDMGTLFFRFIGDTTARLLARMTGSAQDSA